MAQNNSNLIKLLGGGLAIGLIAFLATGSEDPRAKKDTDTKPRSRATAKADEDFTQADFDAKFTPAKVEYRNVFSPLVMASSGGRGSGVLSPNAIPLEFSGGKEQWLYTGTAVIDGVPNALVENSSTGEGEFIKVGQNWKASTVRKITPTSLVLTSQSGRVQTMDLMRDLEIDDKALMNAQVQPVSPQGNRGGQGQFPGQNQGQNQGLNNQGQNQGFGGGRGGRGGGGFQQGGSPAIGGPAMGIPMRGSIGGSASEPITPPILEETIDPAGVGGFSDSTTSASEGKP